MSLGSSFWRSAFLSKEAVASWTIAAGTAYYFFYLSAPEQRLEQARDLKYRKGVELMTSGETGKRYNQFVEGQKKKAQREKKKTGWF